MPKKSFESMGISKDNFIKLTNSIAELNIKEKVSRIKCATLVVCGENDNANINSAKQLNKNIKGSKIEFVKGAGHEINIERPVDLAKVIENYFNNL